MKKLLILFCLIFFLSPIKAQRYFADYMIIGTSLTYRWDTPSTNDYSYEDTYSDYTWNVNVGIRVSKRFFTGIQILNIYAGQMHSEKYYYSIYGIFTQYNFLEWKEKRFCAELSLNRGNYVGISDKSPFYKNDTYYLGVGGGFDLPIKKIKNLSFDLSLVDYFILNNIEDKDMFFQYIIGLNYKFKTR